MPRRALRPCPVLDDRGRPCGTFLPCPEHPRDPRIQHSPSGLYNTPRWRSLRAAHLRAFPNCIVCGGPATVVDHRDAHKGDPVKFWSGPFDSYCAGDHTRKTNRHDGGWGRPRKPMPAAKGST